MRFQPIRFGKACIKLAFIVSIENKLKIEKIWQIPIYFISCKPVSHEDEGGDGVENRHEEVSDGQIDQEVVSYTPHGPMS